MKKESMVGRRLYAWFIDTLIIVVLVFLFDGLVSQPLMKEITDIDNVMTSYIANSATYEKIQDEHQIYLYDEAGKRYYNEGVTEEMKNAFLNDERILALNDTLVSEQEYILGNFILRICLSILFGSLIVYFIIPLCFRRGRTIGKLAAKLAVISDDNSEAKWYKIIIRYFISMIINVYLAVFSLGIVPLVSLLVSINHKDNKALCDLCAKTLVVDSRFK